MYKKRDFPSPLRGRKPSALTIEALKRDSKESYYWIGYLFANARIVRSYSVEIIARVQDENHLERLKKFLHNNNTIRKLGQKGKAPNRVELRLANDELAVFLLDQEISPDRKTRTVPKKFLENDDFWRGYLDANSDIDEDDKPPTFHVQGTPMTIKAFNSYAEYKFKAKGKIIASNDMLRTELIFPGNVSQVIVETIWGDKSVLATDYMRQSVEAYAL